MQLKFCVAGVSCSEWKDNGGQDFLADWRRMKSNAEWRSQNEERAGDWDVRWISASSPLPCDSLAPARSVLADLLLAQNSFCRFPIDRSPPSAEVRLPTGREGDGSARHAWSDVAELWRDRI